MNNPRPRTQSPLRTTQGLTRAEVLAVIDDDTVSIRASSASTAEVLRAEIAIVGYAPATGDRVLAEQAEEGWVVLGVLGAARRRRPEGELITATKMPHGVELRITEGDLTISAPGRVSLQGSEIDLAADRVRATASEVVTTAGRVETEAARIVERAEDVYRHVEGLAEFQAGRSRTLVEGANQLVAKRTTIQSDEDTVIDGKKVYLG